MATITVLYMHVRKKDTKFEMTNEIKNAMSILVLYEYGGHTYDNLEILDDRGIHIVLHTWIRLVMRMTERFQGKMQRICSIH